MATDYRRMYRAREGRMVGGVCAGLGDYFHVDPTLVRLAFALLALTGFAGPVLIVYLVMLIVIPEAPVAVVTSMRAETVSEPVEEEVSEDEEAIEPEES